MATLWGREPALLIGLANALLALAIGFGANITPEQVGLILAAATAVLAVVVRQNVTPTTGARHRADDGPEPGDEGVL